LLSATFVSKSFALSDTMYQTKVDFFNTIPNITCDYVNRLANIAVDCGFESFSVKGEIMQNLITHSLLPTFRQTVLEEELDFDQTLALAEKFE